LKKQVVGGHISYSECDHQDINNIDATSDTSGQVVARKDKNESKK